MSDDAIPSGDPFALFDTWFEEARTAETNDPNAMALATADASGAPSLRMVLLKGHGRDLLGPDGGFVFYTNLTSRKAQAIDENPQAALLFHWKSLRRQIRIEGAVERVPGAMADEYFASRSRDSQLGAVASDQSSPLPTREVFLDRFEAAETRFEGGPVPRPDHWSGFRLIPARMEFWQDRAHRLHERRLFTRDGDAWPSTLLFP